MDQKILREKSRQEKVERINSKFESIEKGK
jgi:hypothetical protein